MGEDDDSEAEYWKDQDEPFLEDERDEDEAMKWREALMTKPARSFPQFSFHKIMYLFDSPSSSKVYHFGKWKISDMAAVKKIQSNVQIILVEVRVFLTLELGFLLLICQPLCH